MFISSFCSKVLIWVLVSSLHCWFPVHFLYFTLYSLHFFFHFVTKFNHFYEILIASVLKSASNKLAISSLLTSFLEFWFVLSFEPYFFGCTCYVVRGGALGIHQGGATHLSALWHCLWGRGQRGNNAIYLALAPLSVTSPATHNQIEPFSCLFLGGWACICSSTLWAPPTDSPGRLAVSPTASTLTGFYSKVLRLYFPTLIPWVVQSVSLPSCSSWYICTWMWDHLVCQLSPHLPGPPAATLPCVLSAPPAYLHPSYQSGWMFLL